MSTTCVAPPLVTDPQVEYIHDLLDSRELFCSPQFASDVQALNEEEFFDYLEELKEKVRHVTKTRASDLIQSLKRLPMKYDSRTRPENAGASATGIQHRGVPAGRYAVTGNDGTTDFYKVDRPKKGRWAGFIFVKLQLSDNYQPIPFRNVQAIIDKIAEAGPESASKRYGRELGACGVCGRTLTNNKSIRLGIGPVCAEKHSWSF